MIKFYRKTATIKAEQFDGSDDMISKYHIEFDEAYVLPFRIETMEGWVGMAVGDWIATDVYDEHWLISDDVFRRTYTQLPVIPDYVADWIKKCKQEYTALSDMLCSKRKPEQVRDWMAFELGSHQFDYTRYHVYQEVIARAWLDGYQVEEDKCV